MSETTRTEAAAVSLTDRVAIVTGGGNGMGERTAHTLSARGATVVIADLDEANGARVASAIAAEGGHALFVRTDATDEGSVRDLVVATKREFGGIDILDNNAAALGLTRVDGAVLETSFDTFQATLRANVGGPFLMCQQVIPEMLARGGGSIINITSVSALAGELALTAYGVSKAAVAQLTRAIATQYGPQGIRCNSVAPSYVSTPNNAVLSTSEIEQAYLRHTLTARTVSPQEVAEVVAFLASDAARQINGHLIPVDGGMRAGAHTVADLRAVPA